MVYPLHSPDSGSTISLGCARSLKCRWNAKPSLFVGNTTYVRPWEYGRNVRPHLCVVWGQLVQSGAIGSGEMSVLILWTCHHYPSSAKFQELVTCRLLCLAEMNQYLSVLLLGVQFPDLPLNLETWQWLGHTMLLYDALIERDILQCGTRNNNLGITPHGASGPRLNIKTVLSTYGDFHVKDKTAVRTSYL